MPVNFWAGMPVNYLENNFEAGFPRVEVHGVFTS
jgi:hypothetical protein